MEILRTVFRENRAVWGLALAGLILRLASLRGSLWYDEAFSAWLATLPVSRLLEATLNDVHPPFYYLLLWVVNRVWGSSEIAIRLPSLLAGMGLVFAVDRLAQRFELSQSARLVAVGLVALAPFQIYYSAEARSYAFSMLAVALAVLGLLDRRWWLVVIGSLVALYLQHTSGFFIFTLFAAGIITDRSRLKPLVFCAGVIGLGYLPGLVLLARQAQGVGKGYWILPLDHPGRVFDTLDSLLFYTPQNPFFLSSLVTALGLVLILADVRQLWSNQRFALLMAGLPLVLVVVVSLVWQSILIARIMAPATPFYYILIAWSVTRSKKRLLLWGGAAVAFLVAINGAVLIGRAGRTLDDYYTIPGYQVGDKLYHTNPASIVLWHYYMPDADHFLWQDKTGLDRNLTTATKKAMGIKQVDFGRIACHHRRWWYISMDNPTSTPGELAHARGILQEYDAQEIKVLRLDRLVDSRLYLIEPECLALE